MRKRKRKPALTSAGICTQAITAMESVVPMASSSRPACPLAAFTKGYAKKVAMMMRFMNTELIAGQKYSRSALSRPPKIALTP